MIIIASKRSKRENILKKYPDAIIADVTSQAEDGLVRLSPFYPHGDIPVPYSEGYTAACVEGIWQGLKVFEEEDIDIRMFCNNTMKGIKRTVRKHGRVLGHRKGVNGTEILRYVEAKHMIYIPTYRWMLEHKAMGVIERLRKVSETKTIVLLDYNTCCDVDDETRPLSHPLYHNDVRDSQYRQVRARIVNGRIISLQEQQLHPNGESYGQGEL